MTSATGQNTDTLTMAYDGAARPYQTISPHGAVTNYGYSFNPPYNSVSTTVTAIVNGNTTTSTRGVITRMDGLGRPVRVEISDASGTKSIVDTEYDSCACSPLGKMKRTSQPYAPGGPIYWTPYTYDGLGRTISVVAPDGAATTYLYRGNATTITDPAGKWKKYVTNAMGQLIQVIEPNPGNN